MIFTLALSRLTGRSPGPAIAYQLAALGILGCTAILMLTL